MEVKVFDCIEMQREIRTELLEEVNYNLHDLIEKIKENNKKSKIYKLLKEKQDLTIVE